MDSVVQNSAEMIRTGSRSFSAAARLFRPEVRDDAMMLYAWCRHCDDEIDGQNLGFAAPADPAAAPHDPQAALVRLTEKTQRALAGEGQGDPVFEALARVAGRHEIPARYPLDLLKGFEMDVAGHTYADIGDTLLYCYRVAGAVGVMMAMIMGARDEAVLDRATDLGIAFQLTNIARDVGDDAAIGRGYLPTAWLAAEGVPQEEVGADRHWPAVARVVHRMLETAEPYYRSARIGLRHLPLRSAWAIATARGVYRDIGKGVRRRGPRAWDRRVSTSGAQKVWWGIRGGLQSVSARSVERLLPDPPRGDLWTRPPPDRS